MLLGRREKNNKAILCVTTLLNHKKIIIFCGKQWFKNYNIVLIKNSIFKNAYWDLRLILRSFHEIGLTFIAKMKRNVMYQH